MTTGEAVKTISVEEAKEKLAAESAQAIDTRPAGDWAGAHSAGALNLPLLAIASRHGEVPKDKDLIFFSEDGVQSSRACQNATAQGIFQDVFNVDGGTRAWLAAGYEVEALN